MEPNSEGHRERLRQRFLKAGLSGFQDYEILELLLTFCLPRRDVKPLAKQLLAEFGNVRNVFDQDPQQLQKITGLGTYSITCIKFIKSIADYYLLEKTETLPLLNNTDALIQFWKFRIGNLKKEVLEVAFLDSSYRLLPNGVKRISEGSPHQTSLYPAKILKSAVALEATYLIMAHNHPSGVVEPSQADITLTNTLNFTCTALSVRLLDHLILAKDGWYSFRKAGLLH